jgi:tRNA (mo5U34)-methyltransferase
MSTAERNALAPDEPAPGVVDALGPSGRDQLLDSYAQRAREEAAGPDPAVWLARAPAPVRAAHERRLELLNGLPLGDLSGKVCVELGVGTRGFASSFPRLQGCARAVGIDFSLAAVNASAAVSAARPRDGGRGDTYLTSRGERIELPDASADLFYAGEALERLENVDAFLEEAHRILKPGGLLVLTTVQAPAVPPPAPAVAAARAPQAPAKRGGVLARVGQLVKANRSLRRLARFVKRRLGGPSAAPVVPPLASLAADSAAVSPEHLGGLTYAGLRRLLERRFEVLQAHGYGGSPAEEDPASAPGLVLLARKRADYRPAGRYVQRRYHHESPYVHYRGGPWEVVSLHRALSGRLATGGEGSWLTLPVEGTGLVLHFWANNWGGEAVVEVGGLRRTVNLYSPAGCFRRVLIDGLPAGRHELRVSGGPGRDPRSQSNEVIFYQAIAYGHSDRPGPDEPADARRARPARSAAERARLREKFAARPWFHTIDLGDGLVTPGCDNSPAKVGYLGLPERLDGLSVLDIGAYDGFFSFECERRGAGRVVAADHYCWTFGGMATKEGFDTCKAALGSRVEEALVPVEEITPQRVGVFDLVLFLGVLYHAPDMVRYLKLVRAVCRGRVILETEIDAEDYPRPAAVFYPGNSLNNDASNFLGPNRACVEAMLREVGFRKVERICSFNMVRRGTRPFHRAVFHAHV